MSNQQIIDPNIVETALALDDEAFLRYMGSIHDPKVCGVLINDQRITKRALALLQSEKALVAEIQKEQAEQEQQRKQAEAELKKTAVIDLKLLEETLRKDGWTMNATEFILEAVNKASQARG